MTQRREQSMFTIGSQDAATINNVAGDMTYVHAPGSSITVHQARHEVDLLRRFLDAHHMPQDVHPAASAELQLLHDQLGRPQPDRRRMADSLRRFTELLQDVGVLASAGAALSRPIESIARWLGAAGVPILSVLGIG